MEREKVSFNYTSTSVLFTAATSPCRVVEARKLEVFVRKPLSHPLASKDFSGGFPKSRRHTRVLSSNGAINRRGGFHRKFYDDYGLRS